MYRPQQSRSDGIAFQQGTEFNERPQAQFSGINTVQVKRAEFDQTERCNLIVDDAGKHVTNLHASINQAIHQMTSDSFPHQVTRLKYLGFGNRLPSETISSDLIFCTLSQSLPLRLSLHRSRTPA
jgi:hypothetical protein